MERAVPDLHSHIDQMNTALREWRDAQQQLEPLEARLRALTERGAELIDRWSDVDERQVHAIAEVEARLREFREVEMRLQHEALERLRAFERTLQQEWSSVRDLHEEPLRQVREQALALAETCRATADLSLRSYERTEARLAALEADLRADVSSLTREVRSTLELVRSGAQPALPPPAAPFPLDSVMRIHEEERAGVSGAPAPEDPLAPRALAPVPVPVSRPSVLPFERDRAEPASAPPSGRDGERPAQDWRLAVALAAGVLIILVAIIWWLQAQMNARLDEAAGRAAKAEQAAAATETQLAAARAETERQSAAAQEAVSRAALLSDVLAAPDLVRFALAGVNEAEGASGHVMWTRSRGLAVSVLGLRPPASGMAYRVWLLSNQAPVKAGTITPDASGRATLVTENPPNLPRPVNGLAVTVESAASAGDTPTGAVVLVRAVQP